MLSQRGRTFLEKHKRRRHASDLQFVRQLFTKVDVSPTEHLLKFQEVFAGYVSPNHSGQYVWGLATSNIPTVIQREGLWITPCSDALEKGPHLDSQGRFYLSDNLQTPVASSCFHLFEQMAFIYEWQEAQTPIVTADCFDVKRFREQAVSQIAIAREENLSDQSSQLYKTDSFVILARPDSAFAWFGDNRPSDCVRKVFREPRSINNDPSLKFPERLRSLFSDTPCRVML